MKTVLIMEDDRFLASAYESALGKKYNVKIAYDGVQGLKQAELEKPDLIVLDLLMPLKDGYEVLEDLKADPKLSKITVIVASNLGQDSEIEKAKKLGAAAYIVKSETSITDVMKMVESHLNK